jgi:predicted DCC family thiol-disulfide oxidoreductase YuxK
MDIMNHKIILFDGVCNLCNRSVNHVIERDKKDRFRFAAFQDEAGKRLITKFNIDRSKTDSIVLIDDDKIYVRSTAALRISRNLGGGYPLFYGLMIIPNFIRNWVYDYVAHNRYKWFGKKDSCMIPNLEIRSKFL